MIVKHNGHETKTYAEHFPFESMPRDSWVEVTPDYILTQCGGGSILATWIASNWGSHEVET